LGKEQPQLPVHNPYRPRSPERGQGGRAGAFLFESRPGLRVALIREFRGARFEPVLIAPDFFEGGMRPLSEGAGWVRPVLIGEAEGARRAIIALRRSGHQNPVLVYQEKECPERAADLIRAGADSVLTLPLTAAELGARITALQRRLAGHAAPEARFGPLTVPFGPQKITVGKDPLPMPEAEATVLRLLALNLNRPVSRDQLYEHLYEASEMKPFMRILDRYVCNLRRRIGAVWPDGAGLIRTMSGYGYMLSCAVPTEQD
jgi:two-component system, cell cycle response regulator CtrA